jgi:hypothetical protein
MLMVSGYWFLVSGFWYSKMLPVVRIDFGHVEMTERVSNEGQNGY